MEKRRVIKNGASVKLTPREYDLLSVFACHAGRIVTHAQILTVVWGPAHKEDIQYLHVVIAPLRSKIENDPNAPTIIKTESGIDYRFGE